MGTEGQHQEAGPDKNDGEKTDSQELGRLELTILFYAFLLIRIGLIVASLESSV